MKGTLRVLIHVYRPTLEFEHPSSTVAWPRAHCKLRALSFRKGVLAKSSPPPCSLLWSTAHLAYLNLEHIPSWGGWSVKGRGRLPSQHAAVLVTTTCWYVPGLAWEKTELCSFWLFWNCHSWGRNLKPQFFSNGWKVFPLVYFFRIYWYGHYLIVANYKLISCTYSYYKMSPSSQKIFDLCKICRYFI